MSFHRYFQGVVLNFQDLLQRPLLECFESNS